LADVDTWLAKAARLTHSDADAAGAWRVDQRLDMRSTPALALAYRDARLAMVCAAAADVVAVASVDFWATRSLNRPAPTWITTPSAVSPFSLLVGE